LIHVGDIAVGESDVGLHIERIAARGVLGRIVGLDEEHIDLVVSSRVALGFQISVEFGLITVVVVRGDEEVHTSSIFQEIV
jgi:hypothetical protein